MDDLNKKIDLVGKTSDNFWTKKLFFKRESVKKNQKQQLNNISFRNS
jgi:hypothetical protein